MLEHLSTGRDTSSRFYVMLNRCHAEAEPTKFVPDAPTIHRLCTAVNRFAKKTEKDFHCKLRERIVCARTGIFFRQESHFLV